METKSATFEGKITTEETTLQCGDLNDEMFALFFKLVLQMKPAILHRPRGELELVTSIGLVVDAAGSTSRSASATLQLKSEEFLSKKLRKFIQN